MGAIANTVVSFETYNKSANWLNQMQYKYDKARNPYETKPARANLLSAKDSFDKSKRSYLLSYTAFAAIAGLNIWDWYANEPTKTRTKNSFNPFIRTKQTKESVLKSFSVGLNFEF